MCVDAGPAEVVACMAVVVPGADVAMNCSFELREHDVDELAADKAMVRPVV